MTSCHLKRHKEKRGPQPKFWLLFLYVFSPPSGPALCKLGWSRVLFVLPEVLTPYFVPIFVEFSLLFLLATASLDSFFLL